MKRPTVSVAMATYNGERFLQEQLDSLARQTLLPYELVACDDGSTDGTLDVLHLFAARAPFAVRIYRNPGRLGFRDNFLRAVELCEGELVAFSDQDDVWLPNKLAACAAEFDSDRVSMVIHLAMLTDANLAPVGRTSPYVGRLRRVSPEVTSLHYMDVIGMTMVFRREVAEPLLRDAVLPQAFTGHDHAMRFVAGAYGSIVPLREVLALHRCYDGNTSGSHSVAAATASAYVSAAAGMRGKLTAGLEWLKSHAGIARATEWHSYVCQSGELRRQSQALRCAAARAEGRLRSMLERSSVVLSRRAEALSERSLLYQEPAAKAYVRFFRMALAGRYRSRNGGGLGLWSLAKDGLIPLQFRRHRIPNRLHRTSDRLTVNERLER